MTWKLKHVPKNILIKWNSRAQVKVYSIALDSFSKYHITQMAALLQNALTVVL